MRRTVTRTATAVVSTLLTASAALLAAAPSAATTTALAYRIHVYDDMSSLGTVYDNMFDGRYTGVLTATGVATCTPNGPEIVLNDLATGAGNPLELETDRACVPYAAEATYLLEWVTQWGVSGRHEVQCVWVKYIKSCSLEGVTISPELG